MRHGALKKDPLPGSISQVIEYPVLRTVTTQASTACHLVIWMSPWRNFTLLSSTTPPKLRDSSDSVVHSCVLLAVQARDLQVILSPFERVLFSPNGVMLHGELRASTTEAPPFGQVLPYPQSLGGTVPWRVPSAQPLVGCHSRGPSTYTFCGPCSLHTCIDWRFANPHWMPTPTGGVHASVLR